MAGKTGNNNVSNESFIDFGALVNKYKRFWWLFVICFCGCMGLSVLYLIVKKPVYQIDSSILVSQEDDGSGMGAALVKNLSLGAGSASVDDEIVVINSISLVKDMVRELKLNRTYREHIGFMKNIDCYDATPITIDAPDAVFDTLSYYLSFKVNVNKAGDKIDVKVKKGWFSTIAEVTAAKFPVTVKTIYGIYVVNTTKNYVKGRELEMKALVAGYQPVSENINQDISANIVSKKSNAIKLSYSDVNVKRGKDILNKIVELYNKRCQDDKDEMAINTGKFIDERLNIIYNDLSTSEADIEKYKRDNNLVDMTSDIAILYGNRTQGESAQTHMNIEYELLGMVRDFINDPANDNSFIPFSIEGSAGSSVSMYNDMLLERAKLASSAKGNNVALKLMDEQIAVVRKNVRTAVDKVLQSMKVRIAESAKLENKAKGKLGNIPTKEREFRELYRQQSIKNNLYTFLLQKREENALVLAATTPKGKIVDKAFAYFEPIAPKKGLVLFIGFFFGLVLPIMILYVKQLFTTRFSSQEELEGIVNAPVLGEICHNRHSSTLVVREGKTSSIVELFRLLRNNVQFMLPNDSKNVILVTSSVSGEGKSFVSLNVASSFALLGKRVALVGMDIRSPKLAEYLQLKATPGVTTYLAKRDLKLADIVQHSTEVQGLDVFVGGPIPPNPSELLLSDRVKQLVTELRAEYDCVIIDSAPIAMVSDTFSLTPYTDLVLYVTRANYTKRSLIRYFNTVVGRGQIKNAGVIINDSNPKLSQGYGYGYGSKEE